MSVIYYGKEVLVSIEELEVLEGTMPGKQLKMLLGWTAFHRDIRHFKRVYLDEQNAVSWDIDPNVDSNVVWNNKVDLCPDTCYVDSIPLFTL